MNSKFNLKGLTVPAVTPLTRERKVDKEGIERLVEHFVANGVEKVFVGGTTGEFASLPLETRRNALKSYISAIDGRLPILYGISHQSTARAKSEVEKVKKLDIVAVVTTPPYYFNYSQREIRRHYELIADLTDLPVIIYDIPEKTKNRVKIQTLKTLSEIENIVGLKDTTGDMKRFQRVLKVFDGKSDFTVVQGTEEYFYHSLLSGADGLVSGIANLCPWKIRSQIDSFENGEYQKTKKIQEELFNLFQIYEPSSFLAGIKMGLKLLGLCEPYLSLPFSSPGKEVKREVSKILTENDVL